jgi:quinol monooxygenase YgiN
MSVLAVVRLDAHRGKGRALCDMLTAGPLASARQAEGCEGVDLFVGVENPDATVVMEKWASIEAHQTYFAGMVGDKTGETMMALIANRDARYFQEVEGD